MRDLYPDVASMLVAQGITASEIDFPNDGYSGARLTSVEQGGQRYVLKRMRYADDWMMRWVGDTTCRDAQFAASPLAERLPDAVRTPALAAAHDGDGWAILSRDITPIMLPKDGVVDDCMLDTVLRAAATMHAYFWEDPLADADFPLLGQREHLTIVSPASGAILVDEGKDFGVARGWELFRDRAPRAAADLAFALFADMTPLLRALDRLPHTLIHGDLKFGNAGVESERLWLIDWANVSRAPAGLEIAWFLAVNSSRLPCSLDEVLARYGRMLAEALGAPTFGAASWERQRAALAVCGLLLYGWGKALDAEDGRPDELAWWCERALEGAVVLGL
ncbi:MAG: phosphotransferase [Chloroflexota bacterium]|nr:phosphotransferase [Chloroflexota bacterium]